MTTSPDELARCQCGRGTYAVPGSESLRTCSLCGYLTSYCKCRWDVSARNRVRVPMESVGRGVRGLVGAALVSSLGTLFLVGLFTSPFMAILGIGVPFGLGVAFFAEWLREGGTGSPVDFPATEHLVPAKRKVTMGRPHGVGSPREDSTQNYA